MLTGNSAIGLPFMVIVAPESPGILISLQAKWVGYGNYTVSLTRPGDHEQTHLRWVKIRPEDTKTKVLQDMCNHSNLYIHSSFKIIIKPSYGLYICVTLIVVLYISI